MSNTQLALPDNINPASWKGPDGKYRPEFWTGLIVVAITLGLGVYFADAVFLWLSTMLTDFIHMVILGLEALALLYLIFGKRPRLMWRVLLRKATSLFVAVYPIEIIEDKLLQMKKKKSVFDNLVGLVKGAIEKLQRIMQKNQSEYAAGMNRAAQAHKMAQSQEDAEEAQKLELQKQLMARRAQRRQNANIGYASLLDRLQKMYKFLNRYSNNIDFLIEDTTDEIEQKKTEYETTQTAFGAFKQAMSILKGSATEEDIYDMAFAQIENTISSQLGMMDHMQELSENFMRGMDIENGAVDQQALDALSAFEQKLITPGADPTLKMVTTDMSKKQPVMVPVKTAVAGSAPLNDFEDLLK
jgi:hypothetical protein